MRAVHNVGQIVEYFFVMDSAGIATDGFLGRGTEISLDTQLWNLQIPKASDVLASRLHERILSGEIGPGMSLPSERDLVNQSGLGRATVRESLQILEIESLVKKRRGRQGGTHVQHPNSALVARSLEIFILGSRLRLDSLLEVRETVAPTSAALAASRRTDAGLAELERLTAGLEAAFDDVKAFLVANWHVAMARMSHNELLAGFMEAIASAILAGTDIADFKSDEIRRDALGAHRRMQQTIRDEDSEAARRRMARHIQAYDAAVMRRAHPAVVEVR